MTLGTLILLGLVIGEIVSLRKIDKQAKRIDELEKTLGKQKRK